MMIYFVYSLQGAFIKMPKFETIQGLIIGLIIPSIGYRKNQKVVQSNF